LAKPELGVALIGYKFMGKAHSNAFARVAFFFDDVKAKPVMKVICGRDETGVKAAAERFGWQEFSTDWREVIKRDDIDIVDICTPNFTHKEMAIAAAEAGKHIICEKPLANTLQDAREMLDAVKRAGVKHTVMFNYRRCPAVMLAKRLISEDKIGQIYHFRGVYLQDWIVDPTFPLVWRLDKKLAGSGALGDIGAHVIDLARFLVGEIVEVVGLSETFIKKRPLAVATDGGLGASGGSQMGEVTVDDATVFLARFENGAIGTFEATRFAPGRKNYNSFEINGSKGSLAFNFEDMNRLKFYSREDEPHAQGFRDILVTEPDVHDYISAWWPPGHIIGYEHPFVHQVYDFLNAIVDDAKPWPNFEDGVKCQQVLEAVIKSCEEKRWVRVEEV